MERPTHPTGKRRGEKESEGGRVMYKETDKMLHLLQVKTPEYINKKILFQKLNSSYNLHPISFELLCLALNPANLFYSVK